MSQRTGFQQWLGVSIFCCLAIVSLKAGAMGPAGHFDSLEGSLRAQIADGMSATGMLNESDFGFTAKTFLWNHRLILVPDSVSEGREADAIVCLLIILHNNQGFHRYRDNGSFREWCPEIIRPEYR